MLKIPVHRRLSHGIRKCQLLWSFAEVVWTADKDVLYDPKKKKKMMTSMSSLFLYGTVFVEVWLVDVGIAEEYSEPVNNPVGVVWTVDQMYFMTCRKI